MQPHQQIWHEDNQVCPSRRGGSQIANKNDSQAKRGSDAKNIHEQPALAGEYMDLTCHNKVIVGRNQRLLAMMCTSDEARKMYQGHSHSYQGDSGIDLFIIKDTTIGPRETIKMGLGVHCVAWINGENVSWMIVPRSSMAKTR